jgi:hypothetical protein
LTNRIKFSVEDVSLVDERNDSQFALVAIDAFASGLNRHEINVPEDVLLKTANSIYEKPIVWEYDKYLNDVGTHSPLEIPAGFITPDHPAEFRKLDDGRTMMRVFGKVWKKYCGKLLEFFQRDGDKPVSVEIEVIDLQENTTGPMQLMDYCYMAVTVLGSLVTPAVPSAQMSIMKFAEQEKEAYAEIYQKEFSSKYDEIDFSIPAGVKKNAKEGLDLHKQLNNGSAPALAMARFIGKNKTIPPERIRNMDKYFIRHSNDDLDDQTSNHWVCWQLYGGFAARKWARKLMDQIDEIDDRQMSYFSGSDDEENLREEENITYMEDEKDEKEKVEEAPEKEECALEDEKKEECAVEEEKKEEENPVEECAVDETKEEEKKESPEDEKKEEMAEEKPEEKEDMSALMSLFAGEEFEAIRGEFAAEKVDYAKVLNALFGMLEDKKKQFAVKEDELEGLRKFKKDIETERFNFAVEATLNEVSDVMPKNEIEMAREDAANYCLETVDIWRNATKAKAFTFAKDIKKNEDGITRYALTWNTNKETKQSIWD